MSIATRTYEVTRAQIELERLFWELVSSQRNRAIAIAYHILGCDLEAAKDVAQDAFLRAYKALPTFRGQAKLSTWFFRILVNQAKSFRRRQWWFRQWKKCTEEGLGKGDVLEQIGQPTRRRDDGELRERILKALKQLSLKQRAVFGLVHLEGCSLEEAAEQLSISQGTAKSHLHRALQKLRNDLKDLERS